MFYTVNRLYWKTVININQLLEGNYGGGYRVPQVLSMPAVLSHSKQFCYCISEWKAVLSVTILFSSD